MLIGRGTHLPSLAIFFTGTKGFWEEERPLIEPFFVFNCKLWIYINRSFSLSNNKNSIWKGKEYADLRCKKTETIPVEGTVVWCWQRPDCLSRFFSLHHQWQWISLYRSLSRFSLSATYVSLNRILGFYVFSSSPLSLFLSVYHHQGFFSCNRFIFWL